MIAGLISTKIGLNSYYWWFSSIIIFSILLKLVFTGNNLDTYTMLVKDYKDNIKDTNCECNCNKTEETKLNGENE